MPSSFFTFQQGSDTRSLPPPDSESLRYGRFRAFSPPPKQQRSIGNLFSAFAGDHFVGSSTPRQTGSSYGSIDFTTRAEVATLDVEDEGEDHRWWLDRVLISPRRSLVKKMVERWWRRWIMFILLPAGISIIWCAIPFPTSPLDVPGGQVPPNSVSRRIDVNASASPWTHLTHAINNLFDLSVLWDIIKSWFELFRDSLPDLPSVPDRGNGTIPGDGNNGKVPGHGSSQVVLNFWFFLIVYYGFYNLVGLLWITKVFNMYSLNWWPPSMGFPPTFTFFNFLPLSVGVMLYYFLPGPLITENLTWIFLTFSTMCCPLVIAFLVLLFERRHNRLGMGRGLSETQLLFTSSSPGSSRAGIGRNRSRFRWRSRPGWWQLPRSYKRFFWFCSAMLLSLLAFALGEAYAELYLRTLPHNSLETVIYVWSWVATIHILDLLTGWILGARVGSYPLGVVFKLYFQLTYQTYVRALYARLRSPSQFAYLQLLSSSIVVIWSPITMTPLFHSIVHGLKLNGQNYPEWQKTVGRSFFVRGLAENVSMAAWLGWVIVLHYGYNTKVYPYFSFNDKNDPYTFSLTFWASLATWGCEIVAGWIVRRVMQYFFRFGVTEEAIKDFGRYPELFPAVVMVMVHVLQNMLFSIVRLRFY
ncbi:hypothetical protein EDC01DRAFT_431048 [Geopyxis carbonaria]|nr:hypothetical protein EDC01DRAFT_431048 [Geopyxis carbonaria]